MRVKEAATKAEVSPALVYHWVSTGLLPHYRVGRGGTRGGIRIADADLDDFLATLRREGGPVPASPRRGPIKLENLRLPP
jgi:excisionase family DNA binding protein